MVLRWAASLLEALHQTTKRVWPIRRPVSTQDIVRQPQGREGPWKPFCEPRGCGSSHEKCRIEGLHHRISSIYSFILIHLMSYSHTCVFTPLQFLVPI